MIGSYLRRLAHLAVMLALTSAFGLTAFALFSTRPRPPHTGRQILVRDGGTGPWYTSIQAAIDAASTDPANPDTIVVESSNQTGGLLIDRPVNLISTIGTTIAAPTNKRALTIDGRNTTIGTGIVIQGFTFQQGDATADTTAAAGQAGIPGCGGGILIVAASPTLANNTIINNKAASGSASGQGGGVCLIQSSAVLTGNAIGNTTGGGNIASAGGAGSGGGVYISGGAPTLSYNTISANQAAPTGAGSGGGVYLDQSAGTLRQNSISRNEAAGLTGGAGDGGGVYINGAPDNSSTAQLIGNGITSNFAARNAAGKGGGIFVSRAAARLQGNVLVLNIASSADASASFGGGIYVDGAPAALTGNVLTENRAHAGAGSGGGGGIWLQSSAATLTSNIVQNNAVSSTTGGPGQAIGISGGGGWLMVNNLIARNALNGAEGSAIAIADSRGNLVHTTIADNSDFDPAQIPTPPTSGQVGLDVGGASAITLTNTIVAGHAIGVRSAAPATVQLSHTLYHRNSAANTDASAGGSIIDDLALSGDPAFADTTTHLPDYHLSANSAAIDKGRPTSAVSDLEGLARRYGSAPDLGAYERKTAALVRIALVMR